MKLITLIWWVDALYRHKQFISNGVNYSNSKQYLDLKRESQSWKYGRYISEGTIPLYVDIREEKYSHCQTRPINGRALSPSPVPSSRKSFTRDRCFVTCISARAILHKTVFLSWCMVILHKLKKTYARIEDDAQKYVNQVCTYL